METFWLILGAIIGAVGSYYGGINGAKQNCVLLQEQTKRQSERELLTQLRYSYDRIITSNPNGTITADTFVYDRDWSRHLANVELNSDERSAIINWFQEMGYLNGLALTAPYREKEVGVGVCKNHMESRGLDTKILAILNMYNY